MNINISIEKIKNVETQVYHIQEIISVAINLAMKAIDTNDNNCDDIITKIIEKRATSNEMQQFCNYIFSQPDDVLKHMYAIYLCGQDICLERIKLCIKQDNKQTILQFLACILEENITREEIIDKFTSVRLNLFVNYISSAMKAIMIYI